MTDTIIHVSPTQLQQQWHKAADEKKSCKNHVYPQHQSDIDFGYKMVLNPVIELVEETATIARLTAKRQMSQIFSLLYIRKKIILDERWESRTGS